MKDEYNTNRKAALAEYNRHVAEYRDIANAIEHEYEHKRDVLQTRFRNEKESLELKSQDAITAMKGRLGEETNATTNATTMANDAFKAKSEGKMQQFNQMYEKYKQRQRNINANADEI